MPDHYTDLRPWDVRPVEVLHTDGAWHFGELEGYRREPDGTWRGSVRYSVGVGMTHVAWLGEDRIRRGEWPARG